MNKNAETIIFALRLTAVARVHNERDTVRKECERKVSFNI